MKYGVPVLIGLLATMLTGLILCPMVYIVLFNFPELVFFQPLPSSSWMNNIVIILACVLWILLPTAAGGYISVNQIEQKEDFVVFLLIVVITAGTWTIAQASGFDFPVFVYVLAGAGCLGGGWLGVRQKIKKIRVEVPVQ
jgi:O-antigen/teichoic acid export membrane protein